MTDISAADFDALRPPSPFMKPEHAAWRDKLRTFIDSEITPHLSAWEKTGTFPDQVYTAAVKAGVFGMGFSQQYGGVLEHADLYHRIILAEEFHRHGSGLVYCDLATYSIALPPLVASGHPDVIAKYVKPILAGELKTAFAVTEPNGGSDVAGFVTTAERKGDTYVLNGAKALISSAMRADMALVVARTGGPGIGGLSLLWVDLRHPGVSRTPAPGLGWYNANIGSLSFKDVPVPINHLVGKENEGFMSLGPQLNTERFSGVAAMLAMARAATAEAMAWAKERQAFGKRLADQQVLRHQIVDMVRRINVAYAYMDRCVWQFGQGKPPIADLSLLKVEATEALQYCADTALHIKAGGSYNTASRLQMIAQQARTFAIAGGAAEILKDLTARQLKI